MKASVKVREGQRPLVRAKIPVQVSGLPFYSGISVGDERELALHVGTNMEAGPSCSLSYRPNDRQSPLAVLLKTGFGLWGSPHAAPFTIAAEFNLARRENVSFTLRVKPRVGSFSFSKHFLSTSGNFGREIQSSERQVQEEVEVEATSRPSGGPTQGDGPVYETDYDSGLSHLGLGQVSVTERKSSSDPGSPVSNGGLLHVGDGSGDMEIFEDGDGIIDQRDGDGAIAVTDRDVVVREGQFKTRRSRLLQNWSGSAHRSWGLTVHSAIPLGRQAMGRVQWGMRMPSNEGGGKFYGYKLPVLVLDKISLSSIEKMQSSAFASDTGPLNYRMRRFENPVDDGSQLGLIASVCCSMRNQLLSLHADSTSLKKIVEDMKADMGSQFGWGGEKKLSLKTPTPEQDSVRSQLFEELQKKTSSRASSPKGSSNESRGVSSGQNQESIFDLPSEGLLDDKKASHPVAKAKAK